MSAFAIESTAEVCVTFDRWLANAGSRDHNTPAGVGKLRGAFRCKEADRSKRAATGDVSGR